MTDIEQLMTVAAWIDKMFPNDPGPEVQTDLRRIAIKLLDLEAELARVKEAAELLARECVAWRTEDDGHKNDVPLSATMDMMLFARKQAERTDANPTAAALVEQARKEKP